MKKYSIHIYLPLRELAIEPINRYVSTIRKLMLASTLVMAFSVPVCFVGDVLLSEKELGGEVHHGGRNSVMNSQHLG